MASRNSDEKVALHSCELCGQDGLKEEEMLTHMKLVHIEGSVQCPFCDLSSKELTADQMSLHVNTAHLEYLTPEQEFGGGFKEFDDDFEGIWQLEREAKEGLTNGLSDSPTDETPKSEAKRPRAADSCIDSPMSTCTDTSQDTEASQRFAFGGFLGECSSSSVTSSPGPHRPPSSASSSAATSSSSTSAAVSGGAIQKRLRPSVGQASPSRSNLSLDVRPHKPREDSFPCPLCDHKESDPIRLEDHVNRSHFDPTSPSKADNSQDDNNDETSVASCPICGSSNFDSVLELERHVNLDHGDILSPEEKRQISAASPTKPPSTSQPQTSSQPDSNGNQVCPVCNRAGFDNQNQLAEHIEDHFSKNDSSLANSFSNSSSRSSVFSSASKSGSDSSSHDQLQNDYLLAQEIARREREKRKHEEEKEFLQLRAQFGMDNEGNYRQQSLTNMQKAVYNGKMSVVDYYERQIDLKQSEQNGVDDGHSVTKNLIPRLRTLCQQTGGVSQVYLCTNVAHHASSFGDKGWGCGYRNLQMLLSSLQCHSTYSDKLGAVFSNGGTPSIPSISKLQILIEAAWSAGFDVQGREQLGGRLQNTRKWIGATEIVAFLTANRIKTELVDFHVPSARDGTHPRLFQWVLNYFKEHTLQRKFCPPLYFQHQGHSRTIIGVEVLGNEAQPRLLIFDPSHSKSHMASLLKNDNTTMSTLRMLRKTASAIKSKQYQIVAVTGTYSSDQEASGHKVIHSRRIP